MTENKTQILKVGVIGCGQISQIMHLPYLHDSPNFEIIAISDISRAVLQAVGKKYNISTSRQFVDYSDLLDLDEVQAVFICTKDHYLPVILAAEAGKHIFVEKPLGFSLMQAEEMVSAAKRANVCLMVGYMKRYDASYIYLLDRIKELDNVHLVRLHSFGGSFDQTKEVFDLFRGDDIPDKLIQNGKQLTSHAMLEGIGEKNHALLKAYSILLGVASHGTVLLRHCLGNEPEVVYAHATADKAQVIALLRFGDIDCILESNLVMQRRIWDEKIQIFSDKANLTLEFPWPYLKNAPTNLTVDENYNETEMPSVSHITTSFSEAYRNEINHFYECVCTGKTPITSGEDALHDLRLFTAIIEKAGDAL